MQVWVAKGFVNPLGHQTSETEIGGGWRWVQSESGIPSHDLNMI